MPAPNKEKTDFFLSHWWKVTGDELWGHTPAQRDCISCLFLICMAYRSSRRIKSVGQDLIFTRYWVSKMDCSFLLDSLLTLKRNGLVLLLLGICVGWHEGTQSDLPTLQTTLCGRRYAGHFTRISHLVFTTAQRGFVTLFQFSSSGNWGSEVQRIFCTAGQWQR